MPARPPLPPDAGTPEDAPTTPEQVPGSGAPIVPPKADPATGDSHFQQWAKSQGGGDLLGRNLAPDTGSLGGNVAQSLKDFWKYRTGGASTPGEIARAYGGQRVGEENRPVESVVTNPESALAKLLQKINPGEYAAAEAAPGRITFRDYPQQWFNEQQAFGTTTPMGRTPINQGKPVDVSVGVSPEAFRNDIGEAVASHELAGHAVPLATSGAPFPYGAQEGMNRIVGELRNPLVPQYTPNYMGRLLGTMRGAGGPAHVGIELDANRVVAPQGYRPLLRSMKDIDPELASENASYLQTLMRSKQ